MKLALTHPLRDFWLRLKALLVARRSQATNSSSRTPKPSKHHRTTAFFELP